ncbi:MAG: sugar phosphate isomerase/epimerase [Thermoguttaceae bacterium]|nr:sugar phosphate isomerase/epimerase [Thermoguttaceae bacterium]
MARRPITIITGQFGDVKSDELFEKTSKIGYDGLELACGTDHFDVQKCLKEEGYCAAKKAQLEKYGLGCWALSNHCVGQGVLDQIDQRNLDVIPEYLRSDDKEQVAKNCAEEMKDTARAAKMIGASIVTGFTGSSIWPYIYSFPPVPQKWIDDGFKLLKERWTPILDVYQELGIKFALEVHPTEIAFDIHSAQLALEALDYHPAFGFNFDPSHLVWQMVDPVKFIRRFPDRIFHVHMKDAALQLDGENGILGSHLPFGDYRRGWEFRSLGRGDVDFEEIVRALNDINYQGPLSVEWEDQRMDRWFGATESFEFVKKVAFPKNEDVVFDAQFAK